MPGKKLTFENGEPVDDCDHDDVLDRPGANPVCIDCGTVNPPGYDGGDDDE